jgi:DNA-binding response OmpR family regulator
VRALGRRTGPALPAVLDRCGIRLDPGRREVYRDGRYLPLTRKEFAVLEELLRAGGGVVSAEQLLERAWDENADPFTNVVRVTIMTLRRKLGEPQPIRTLPGVGYQIP